MTISAGDFDHGRTRQLALDSCRAEFFVLLSDDADPVDSKWLDNLLLGMQDPSIGAVYGRHKPRRGASVAETVFRLTRYPEHRLELKSPNGGEPLLFPVSDANVAYRTAALRSVAGFPVPCPYGEDQIVLNKLLHAGWHAVYVQQAATWHSHELSLREIFRRALAVGKVSGAKAVARVSVTSAIPLIRTMLLRSWQSYGFRGAFVVGLAVMVRVFGFFAGRIVRT